MTDGRSEADDEEEPEGDDDANQYGGGEQDIDAVEQTERVEEGVERAADADEEEDG
jgi:hypothetical protein